APARARGPGVHDARRGARPREGAAGIPGALESPDGRAASAVIGTMRPLASSPFPAAPAGAIGPDFVYGLPWGAIRTALAVGGGTGPLAALLAARAQTVIAAEPGPSGALPYPPETFDLVALNGSTERLGPRFLENAFRLLKPEGFLYLSAGA